MVVQDTYSPVKTSTRLRVQAIGARSTKALGKASWEALTELLKCHLRHYFSFSWFLLRNSCLNRHMVIYISIKMFPSLKKETAQKQFILPAEVCHGEAKLFPPNSHLYNYSIYHT